MVDFGEILNQIFIFYMMIAIPIALIVLLSERSE